MTRKIITANGIVSYDKDIRKTTTDRHLAEFKHSDELATLKIPTDPAQFYQSLGLIEHPKTRKIVRNLAGYQVNRWKEAFRHKYRMIIKSQKVGITTSALMEDFQRCILPTSHPLSCRGQELLLIAQDLLHAKDHLYTLRKMIAASSRYHKFLITKANDVLSRDEVTKVTTMYLRNPENEYKPTRIIALGAKEGPVWSWKEVKHVHMSDVAATNATDDSGLFGAAFSRLANTDGTMLIETPPRGQRGKVWEIYQASKLNKTEEQIEAAFDIKEIPAEMGVQAGLITQEFLDNEKERHPLLYSQLYECKFLNPYNSWYEEAMIKYNDTLASRVD